MKLINLIFLILFSTLIAYGQKPAPSPYAPIDKLALQLPDSLTNTTTSIAKYVTDNFQSDKDKARAIFIWIATNVRYDIENMFAINFYATAEEKINKPLQTRKGICANYAALFNDLCSKSRIKSYVVEGYTKQNGFTDYIPHAWCAALIDSTWLLFDPTWGSGYIYNAKFYSKINNEYFSAKPATLVKSHMPFDYMWQFLNYPVTNQEFYEGKTHQNKTKPFFSYQDSILAYEKMEKMDQLKSSAARIEKNGVKNSMIFDRLQHIKLEIENIRQTAAVNNYNGAVADYNEGVNYFNDFINYRNKQFTPTKPDAEIKNMLDLADNKISSAITKLGAIKEPDASLKTLSEQLMKSISDVSTRIDEQQAWLDIYFSKSKSGRKSMFYDKITWFGIPLK